MNSAVKRNLPSVLLTAIVIAAVVMINVIVFTLSSTFGWYLYSQPQDDFSISETGSTLFAEAMEQNRRVTVTFCMYEDELVAHPTGTFVARTAAAFAEKYPQLITVKYVNIITQLDSEGNEYDVTKYQTDMRGNETRILKTSVIFESDDGNYRVITDAYTSSGFADFYTLDSSSYITSYNGEEVFASMISWVLTPEHKTAYITVGHGETSTLPMYNLLTCAGYYVTELDLKKGEIPEDAGLLVISNPRNDFEQAAQGSSLRTEIERMRTYAEGGGCFLVVLDPVSRELPVLESFMGEFGIGFAKTEDGKRQTVKDPDNAITTDGFTIVAEYAGNELTDSMADKASTSGGILLRDVAAVSTTGDAHPLLVSSSSAICQAGGQTTDSSGSYTLAAYSTLASESGDGARMVFIPSVFIAAADAMVTNGYSNKDFLYSVFDVYYGMGDMPYGCNSVVYDTEMLENLTMGTVRWYTAAIFAIPAVIAVVGAVVIVRRKNR